MINTDELIAKYHLEEISDKKSLYEQNVADISSSRNKSEDYAELGYYSQLYNMVTTLIQKCRAYADATELIKTEEDPALLEMAKSEIATLESEIPSIDESIKEMEIEHKFFDPDDMRSVIIEVRAGAGGEEASLFAADLFRMYTHYADTQGWKVEVIEESTSSSGGYKEIIAKIQGENVYKKLKYESGVHRVQRIPTTESSGRIHTSTASVAILPEAKDIDIVIKNEDLRIDVMRATGAGGQCVNRTDSAVRITHIPTSIVVSCQETKHQSQNKEKAMETLRARLYERKKNEEHSKRDEMRSSQIGNMMRAEKIRTYNFPQSRITDHRIKKSWFNIESVMNGALDEIVSDISNTILEMRLKEEV